MHNRLQAHKKLNDNFTNKKTLSLKVCTGKISVREYLMQINFNQLFLQYIRDIIIYLRLKTLLY